MKNKLVIIVASIIVALIVLKVLISIGKFITVEKYKGKIIAYPVYYQTIEKEQKVSYTGFINSHGELLPYVNGNKKGIQKEEFDNAFSPSEKDNEIFKNSINSLSDLNKDISNASNDLDWKEKLIEVSEGVKDSLSNLIKEKNEQRCYPSARYTNLISLPEMVDDYESLVSVEDYKLVYDNNKYGISDKNNKIIIPTNYTQPNFKNYLTTPYISNRFYGDDSFLIGGYYFNKEGKKLFEKQFDSKASLPFIHGIAWAVETKISKENNNQVEVVKVGYINKKGKWVWSVKSTPKATIILND